MPPILLKVGIWMPYLSSSFLMLLISSSVEREYEMSSIRQHILHIYFIILLTKPLICGNLCHFIKDLQLQCIRKTTTAVLQFNLSTQIELVTNIISTLIHVEQIKGLVTLNHFTIHLQSVSTPTHYRNHFLKKQLALIFILTRSRKYGHITPILQSLHWLPIKFRISYKILLLTFKALNGLAPAYLTSLLSRYNPTRSLRSQNSGLLVVPRIAKSTKGGRAFSYLAPKLWNSLLDNVRGSNTLSLFKSRLKTHLFSQAFT